jgi:hypothetical protein
MHGSTVLTAVRERLPGRIASRWPRRRSRTPRAYEGVLADPRSYERQMDRLLDRHAMGRGMHELRQGDVSLGSAAARQGDVARLLARTVSSGAYVPAPAELRTIRVGGKRRTVFALGLVDLLVHGVVSDALEAAIEPTLSPQLLSYRPGVPWWRGPQALAAWIRAWNRGRGAGGARQGGLYVIRRDVRSYTDTIPVGDDSALWPMIRTALAPDGEMTEAAWAVTRAVVRPAILGAAEDGGPRERGVPTGQPISCVLFNLYLRDVDHELAAIPGGFYARYSDDVVFAHPDAATAQRAAAILDERLEALDLSLNTEKSADLYLTRAGHASADWPQAKGVQAVPLLGLQVGADGTVGLEPAKARELVRDLRRRAWAAAAASADFHEAARLACAVVRRALDPGDMQTAARAAPLLRHVVTDRRQLADLDRRIAAEIAGVIVGDRTVRAFRTLPPAELRERYGLPSLVLRRNGRGAASRPGGHGAGEAPRTTGPRLAGAGASRAGEAGDPVPSHPADLR